MHSVTQLLTTAWLGKRSEIAIISATRQLSGAELLRRISTIASILRSHGVKRGTNVGIHLPRSIDQIASLFAVVGVGATYVPLDPSYPCERLSLMANDASLHAILGAPLAGCPATVIDLGSSASDGGETPQEFGFVDNGPDELAYVIYTSGSTGTPKGVQITHANLAAFLSSWDSLSEPDSRQRWLSLTSLNFDPSVVEIIWSLTRGHTVVLAPEAVEPGDIGRLIAQHAITHLQSTPTRAQLLLADDTDRVGLSQLQEYFIGGEALTASLAGRLCRLGPAVTNIYGPTETTVWAFAHRVSADDLDPIPIGRPLPGVEVRLESVPAAGDRQASELVLGGFDVSPGYWRRPDETAHAFSESGARRWYRTGDLVQALDDGSLRFLGRSDSQIKIAGHRVEAAEIETIILGNPAVLHAAAVRVEGPGGPQIVAFAVPRAGEAIDVESLRSACTGLLPAAVVPSRFEVVEAMPTTPSGKIDRGQLARRWLDVERNTDQSTVDRAGVSSTEQMIGIWSTVFGRTVREDDDFFALGGDSLTAIALLSSLPHATELRLSALVEAPTPRRFAEALATRVHAGPWSMVRLRPTTGEASRRLAFIHGAGGNIINFVHAASLMESDVDVVGFQALGVAGGTHDATVESMAERYIAELAALASADLPLTLAGYSDGGLVAWEMAQRLRARSKAVDLVLIETSRGPASTVASAPRKVLNVLRNLSERDRSPLGLVRDAITGWRDITPFVPAELSAEQRLRYDVGEEVESASSRYAPKPLAATVTLVRSRHTSPVVWLNLRWRDLVDELRVIYIDGDHIGIAQPASASQLAEALAVANRAH